MLASGVTYYPPPPMAPPDYSSDPPVTDVGSPLLDISVEKIIAIVQREMARIEDDTYTTTTALRNVELHDREDIQIDEEAMSSHVSLQVESEGSVSPVSDDSGGSSSSSALGRAPSKRRRNRLDLPGESDVGLGTTGTYRRSPAGHGTHDGFEKEMLGLLECDVCASLLHEPVTTPCQHVSGILELFSK